MAPLSSFFGLAMYFVPWIVANHRRHHNQVALFCLNLFLGWTLIGWVVALVWALSLPPIVVLQSAIGTALSTSELAQALAKQAGRTKSIGKVVLSFLAAVGIMAVIATLAETGSDKESAPSAEPKKSRVADATDGMRTEGFLR
jgi:hypothetical protein